LGPVAFSPDGHTLATSGGNKALLWDVTDRTKPRQLDPPLMSDSTSYGTWAAFSPDGHTLATTASSDKMVILWDVTDRTKPHQLGLPLTGYTDAVSTMAFSPDGHTLATGNLDENLLWDVTDQDQPRQLGPLHASGLDGDDLYGDSGKSMAFSPDGHTLAVVNIGQTVLWDLTPIEDLRRNTVREACIRTGKPLDTVMWAFYAPDISYQDTCADAIGPK
jgi:WD40 repeat protein